MNNKGLSLVELLIVIVVMAIISAFGAVAVSEILDNTRQGAFVANANTILDAAETSYSQGDAIWDDGTATLGDIINAGYVEIGPKDPWGGLYDYTESYVVAEVTTGLSNEIYLSISSFALAESVVFKIKLVSTTATIGFDAALDEFDKSDIVYLEGGGSLIDQIIEMFDNDLDGDLTTDNGDDEVNVTEDVDNGANVNLQDGNDTLNIGDDVQGNSSIDMGAGDDIINMEGEVKGSSTIDTGEGNDTVTIDDDIQDNSTVNTGDGDDTVTVGDDLQSGAVLNTGNGNDTVTVNDELDRGTINTGEGADTINIDRIRSTSYINAGAGDDILIIDDVSSTFDNGAVDMGAGDDTVTLRDSLSGSKGTWDGGSGNDTLNLPDVTVSKWNSSVGQYFSNFETVVLKDGTVYP